MTRFVGLNGVWVNPALVTSLQTTEYGATEVSFGRWAIEVSMPLGEVVDLLETDNEVTS